MSMKKVFTIHLQFTKAPVTRRDFIANFLQKYRLLEVSCSSLRINPFATCCIRVASCKFLKNVIPFARLAFFASPFCACCCICLQFDFVQMLISRFYWKKHGRYVSYAFEYKHTSKTVVFKGSNSWTLLLMFFLNVISHTLGFDMKISHKHSWNVSLEAKEYIYSLLKDMRRTGRKTTYNTDIIFINQSEFYDSGACR